MPIIAFIMILVIYQSFYATISEESATLYEYSSRLYFAEHFCFFIYCDCY